MRFVPFAFLSALFLTACGGEYRDPPAPASGRVPFGSQSVQVLNGSITADGSTLAGSGTVLFDKAYLSVRSNGSYALNFTLEEGGSVTLVSHGDAGLNNGYEMKFERQPNGRLMATITTLGEPPRDTDRDDATNGFADLDATLPILLQIDVHNKESPAHSLAWNRAIPGNFTAANSIFNSEDNDNSPGIGQGTRWGLRLNRAIVSWAEQSDAKAAH